jgi:hypothetical protein
MKSVPTEFQFDEYAGFGSNLEAFSVWLEKVESTWLREKFQNLSRRAEPAFEGSKNRSGLSVRHRCLTCKEQGVLHGFSEQLRQIKPVDRDIAVRSAKARITRPIQRMKAFQGICRRGPIENLSHRFNRHFSQIIRRNIPERL